MPRPCKHNPKHMIADDADPRKQYCGTACRVGAFQVRQARRAELLDRMTAALASGADPQMLEALRREAAQLLN